MEHEKYKMKFENFNATLAQIENEHEQKYQATLIKIKEGNAVSSDYIDIVLYLKDKPKPNKALIENYLNKCFTLAHQELKNPDTRNDAITTLATYHRYKKEYQKAIEYYNAAIKTDPDVSYVLVRFYTRDLNNTKKAIEVYNNAKSSRIDPVLLKAMKMEIDNYKSERKDWFILCFVAIVLICWIIIEHFIFT